MEISENPGTSGTLNNETPPAIPKAAIGISGDANDIPVAATRKRRGRKGKCFQSSRFGGLRLPRQPHISVGSLPFVH